MIGRVVIMKMLLLVSSLLISNSFDVQARPEKSPQKSLKKRIERKIASDFEVSQGDVVFSKLLTCVDKERKKGFFEKAIECMSPYFPSEYSYSKKVDLIAFVVRAKNFSSLSKCSYEELEKHPSALEDSNNFVLCSEFSTVDDDEIDTALIYFKRRGKTFDIVNIKD